MRRASTPQTPPFGPEEQLVARSIITTASPAASARKVAWASPVVGSADPETRSSSAGVEVDGSDQRSPGSPWSSTSRNVPTRMVTAPVVSSTRTVAGGLAAGVGPVVGGTGAGVPGVAVADAAATAPVGPGSASGEAVAGVAGAGGSGRVPTATAGGDRWPVTATTTAV